MEWLKNRKGEYNLLLDVLEITAILVRKKITNTLKTTPNNDFPKFSCTENSNSMPNLKTWHRIYRRSNSAQRSPTLSADAANGRGWGIGGGGDVARGRVGQDGEGASLHKHPGPDVNDVVSLIKTLSTSSRTR